MNIDRSLFGIIDDPHPKQVDFREWRRLFKSIPDELIETTRYYRDLPDAEWSQYLFPPSTHLVYGNRLLRKLRFDNSLAALRLWGYVMSEGERIFRARQAGKKVVAVMGDLGAATPLIYSFKDTIAFYPDCLWWTPFLMESRTLFDEAAQLGMNEDCCYVRAALGGFSKRAYFPQPDLSIGTVGATCDDMAAVMSEASYLGYDIHYFELPFRDDSAGNRERLAEMLAGQYALLSRKIEEITGQKFSESRFGDIIEKANLLRKLIKDIKDATARSTLNPMGAVELLNVEFAALSYYGDLDECLSVVYDVWKTIEKRSKYNRGYSGQDVRIIWVTPPADPILMNDLEKLGGRVVGSEYVINQTKPQIDPSLNPFQALAEAQIQGSLMGGTDFRAQLVLDQAAKRRADGVVISGVFGSTHCPYETYPIIERLRKESVPVLAFDVVAPGKVQLQSQIFNRMEAFMESLKIKKERNAR